MLYWFYPSIYCVDILQENKWIQATDGNNIENFLQEENHKYRGSQKNREMKRTIVAHLKLKTSIFHTWYVER